MSTATQTYSAEFNPGASSRIATVFRRVPLVMFTAIFIMISFRYLVHPVHYAAEAGISFTSPGRNHHRASRLRGLSALFRDSRFDCAPLGALALGRAVHGADRGLRRYGRADCWLSA
jgi:hypothetical protein